MPKIQYETLKKRASLYERVFKLVPEKFFPTEKYSQKRIKDFLREDGLDKKTRERLEKILK